MSLNHFALLTFDEFKERFSMKNFDNKINKELNDYPENLEI